LPLIQGLDNSLYLDQFENLVEVLDGLHGISVMAALGQLGISPTSPLQVLIDLFGALLADLMVSHESLDRMC